MQASPLQLMGELHRPYFSFFPFHQAAREGMDELVTATTTATITTEEVMAASASEEASLFNKGRCLAWPTARLLSVPTAGCKLFGSVPGTAQSVAPGPSRASSPSRVCQRP